MRGDLSMILTLRKVLQSVGNGRGIAESIVRELAGEGNDGRAAARSVFLGLPLPSALRPLIDGKSREVSMLASIIVESSKGSAPLGGKKGEALSYTVERWVKARENNRLEEKVQRFRSLIASGVLGAVSGMIATLGPLLGSFGNGFLGLPSGQSELLYCAAAMTVTSSAMLGLFTAGRGFYVNVFVSAAAFGFVSFLMAPLAALPAVPLWGVK
ncbi:MAG: hypothetical protein OK404_01270 [Thaumarchaeota archaeon]|nr:hypothetical protein [Nitrososphaerota archaeon]